MQPRQILSVSVGIFRQPVTLLCMVNVVHHYKIAIVKLHKTYHPCSTDAGKNEKENLKKEVRVLPGFNIASF